MKLFKSKKAIVAFFMCCIMAVGFCFASTPVVEAKSKDEIKSELSELEAKSKELEREIAALKKDKAAQNKIKSAVERQISNTQQQINLCNSRITQFNNEIAANEKEIARLETEKEKKMYLYRCRMRAIHMSNDNSSLQVLLGEENFSDYLALLKYSETMSVYNQRMVDEITATQKEIDSKRADIEANIKAQDEVKATLAVKKAELNKQVAEVNAVISDINAVQTDVQNENKDIERQIAALEAELSPYYNINTGTVYDGSAFSWPVPGHYKVTSYYGPRWGTMHRGIDISDGRIYNEPIIAPANGVVVKVYNKCKHNYGKERSCGCGSGWGNHVMIDHGNNKGVNYKSLSGHMTKAIVYNGQKVKKGQVIGYVGSTGWSTGWHCHFEIYKNGSRVDPMQFYKKVK